MSFFLVAIKGSYGLFGHMKSIALSLYTEHLLLVTNLLSFSLLSKNNRFWRGILRFFVDLRA